MGEKLDDSGKLIPGWNDYVLSRAEGIQASFGEDVVNGKTQAGHFLGAAENIRQLAQDEGEEAGRLWGVSRVLRSKHVTREQLKVLWRKATGNSDELAQILDRLDSLGELEG